MEGDNNAQVQDHAAQAQDHGFDTNEDPAEMIGLFTNRMFQTDGSLR